MATDTELDPTADDLAVPDEVTALFADLEDWTSVTPAPYPFDQEDERDAQDDLEGLGGPGDSFRHSWAAIQYARDLIKRAVYVGVGYCLKTVREDYAVSALYPDAETAIENLDHLHRETDPDKIPWGVPVWWTNGRHGHVALSIGRGRCITTDYGRPGYVGIARIADLGSWCGGKLVGWSNDINGVIVWRPKKAKAKPAPTPFGLQDRLALVEGALKRAKKNNAKARRITGLTKWRNQLQARLDKQKKG